MQLHEVKAIHKMRKSRRVARGGKRGTYSGRGLKGQKSRAGARIRPALRDLIKKFPKLRGWKLKSIQGGSQIVNLEALEKKFQDGGMVTPQTLLESGLIRKIKGKLPDVKLLGEGEVTKKLLVKDCQISKSAKEKIEKAGGKVQATQIHKLHTNATDKQ